MTAKIYLDFKFNGKHYGVTLSVDGDEFTIDIQGQNPITLPRERIAFLFDAYAMLLKWEEASK